MTKRVQREKLKINLEITKSNQVTFGIIGLRIQDPKVQNSLPCRIKVAENLEIFERVVKFWNGKTCNCKVNSIYEESFQIMTDLVYVTNVNDI